MPTVQLARMVTPTDTNLEADYHINNLVVAWDINDAEDANYNTATVALTQIYTNLSDYRASYMNSDAGACFTEWYTLDGKLNGLIDLGSPHHVIPWTLPPPSGVYTPLPEAVAVKVTMFGLGRETAPVEAAGSRPKQRRTGGFFVGGWNHNGVSLSAGHTIVASQVRALLRDGIQAATADLADMEARLCVWSRADAIARTCTGGYIDDRWDTSQSRDPEAQVRTPWTAVLPA